MTKSEKLKTFCGVCGAGIIELGREACFDGGVVGMKRDFVMAGEGDVAR